MRINGRWNRSQSKSLAASQSFWTGDGSPWPSSSLSTWSTMRTDIACQQFWGWVYFSNCSSLSPWGGPSLHDSLCKLGLKSWVKRRTMGPMPIMSYGPVWALFWSHNSQDAQDELCGDRRCDTFEMGFIPTAFIIFYFAVTDRKDSRLYNFLGRPLVWLFGWPLL